jgi:hypothetical protein
MSENESKQTILFGLGRNRLSAHKAQGIDDIDDEQ